MKPVILTLTGVYLPGYLAGGPVRSLSGMVDGLSEDFSWKIVTSDRDFGAKKPYGNIQSNCWVRVGHAEVWYATPDFLRSRALFRLIRGTSSDLIYLNSYFNPYFAVAPMIGRYIGLIDQRPVLIAPRGEFSPGALMLKRCKKSAYLLAARMAGLYQTVYWHATAENEREDIMQTISPPLERVKVAPNIPATLSYYPRHHRADNALLRVCFLSRISMKKNLEFAIKSLALIKHKIFFTVYGPIEDHIYWNYCLRLANELPKNIIFKYEGPIPHEHVSTELARHDLFFLPTLGENFGHALIEAWSAGLLVLTSDQTPWRNLIEAGVGWDLPLGNPADFAQAINEIVNISDAERMTIAGRCHDYAKNLIKEQDAVEFSRQMFLSILK